jgi:hypothetical protein
MEEMIGKTILVKSDPALPPEQFDIHAFSRFLHSMTLRCSHMVANCDRNSPLLRCMMLAAFAFAIGFSLNAAAQTTSSPDASANGQTYSSSADYRAYISTDALLGGSSSLEPADGASASASPQYGGGGRRSSSYPSYESRFSHIAFEGGFGFSIPVGSDTSLLYHQS